MFAKQAAESFDFVAGHLASAKVVIKLVVDLAVAEHFIESTIAVESANLSATVEVEHFIKLILVVVATITERKSADSTAGPTIAAITTIAAVATAAKSTTTFETKVALSGLIAKAIMGLEIIMVVDLRIVIIPFIIFIQYYFI